jgi:NADH-quinone oxidoreductase subunit J
MFNEFLFFIIFSICIFFFSFFVIASQNAIHSILSLVFLFFSAASLLILLGVEFLGMLFLIIYIGAIAVLFLFVVMMLNLKSKNIQTSVFRYFPIFLILFFFLKKTNFLDLQILFYNYYFNPIIFWHLDIKNLDNASILGFVLYTFYFYLFFICGIVLLISMLGAISLTLHKRNDIKKQQIYKQVETNFDIVIKWKI